MSIKVFLISEAFVARFLLSVDVLRLLVFLERVEMSEKLGSLGRNGIVERDVYIESTWSLESIIESVRVVCRSE